MTTSRLALKHRSGWFAAGSEMLRASQLLSDGAFKLFVYLCLTASRSTGRLPIRHRDLARALSKSRRSIVTYLQELSRRDVCRLSPGLNQHQSGEIEINDVFWPYHKSLAANDLDILESGYIEQVKTWFLAYPQVRSSFAAADQNVARQLYRKHVPLMTVERAILLGVCRKYITELNSRQSAPIASLKYFLPLIEEVEQINAGAGDNYWTYLRRSLGPPPVPLAKPPA